MPRYKYEDRPITEHESKVLRKRKIEKVLKKIKHRKNQITKCEEYISKLRHMPLDTHIRIQITLNEGDDGYEDAQPNFNEHDYQGDLKWINTQ